MNNEMMVLLNQVSNIDDSIESDYFYNGIRVPRVTKIISRCIHNDGLMHWANSLGFKHQSYSKTLSTAASIGSECHTSIDTFLDTGVDVWPESPESRNAYESFKKWFTDISYYSKVQVLMHEKTIVCKYFGGTLDGLYNINGRIYLIDYKTSNHITFNYCLQLAAYIYMLRTEMNIFPDGCIILQLSKAEAAYNEYSLDLHNMNDKKFMDDCENTFLSMVYYFYNLCNIENQFNKLNWR